MTTTWVSFTDTWKAFARGDVSPELTDRYAFGCDRRHLFREDGLVPVEVTWAAEIRYRETVRDAVTPDEIPSPLLEKWRAFENVLTAADAEGRISYRIGSYAEYVDEHPEAVRPGY